MCETLPRCVMLLFVLFRSQYCVPIGLCTDLPDVQVSARKYRYFESLQTEIRQANSWVQTTATVCTKSQCLSPPTFLKSECALILLFWNTEIFTKAKRKYNLLSDMILCSKLQQNYQEYVMNYVLLTEHTRVLWHHDHLYPLLIVVHWSPDWRCCYLILPTNWNSCGISTLNFKLLMLTCTIFGEFWCSNTHS